MTNLEERVTDARNVVLWRVAGHDEVFEDPDKLWHQLVVGLEESPECEHV